MISLLTDSSKWDEAADNSYYPSVSYKFGWLRSIGLYFSYLKPLPSAKVDEEGSIEYVCPCLLDKKRKEIVGFAFLTEAFAECPAACRGVID
jgi:hypothetical protein